MNNAALATTKSTFTGKTLSAVKSNMVVPDSIRSMLEEALTKPRDPGFGVALFLITRCTPDKNAPKSSGGKPKFVYESIEMWKDGRSNEHLLKSHQLSGRNISRLHHSPFAVFRSGQYEPITMEEFASHLADWIIRSRISSDYARKVIDAFLACAIGDYYSLDLYGNVDFSKPLGF